jgi:hypothetical protein
MTKFLVPVEQGKPVANIPSPDNASAASFATLPQLIIDHSKPNDPKADRRLADQDSNRKVGAEHRLRLHRMRKGIERDAWCRACCVRIRSQATSETLAPGRADPPAERRDKSYDLGWD